MSNIMSAATRIRTVYISLIRGEKSHRLAEYAARWLQDDGLLAPDLPEGYEDAGEDGQIVVFRHGNVVARLDLGDVWDEEAARSYWPDEARQHAYDLLAAANAAEEGNNE